MNVYRHKKTRLLYKIYEVSPRGYTGSWKEAVPIYAGETIKKAKMDDFFLAYRI